MAHKSAKYFSTRKRIYDLVEAEGGHDWFDRFMIVLILLNILAVCFESVADIGTPFRNYFYYFELFSIGVFSIEYVLRIWACPANPKYDVPWGRLKFAIRPIAIVDLLSFLPFFVTGARIDLRHLQMFKMVRYSESVRYIVRIITSQSKALISGLILIIMLMMVSGTALYYLEHSIQPKVFSSIPASLWWAIVTITTLGYGDIFPITILGKVVGGLTAVSGIALFALPAGVMGAAFLDHLKEEREKNHPPKFCSHCGTKVGE